MNNVNLIGNLTRDIELKKTPNDISVATFTVAVSRNFKTDGGAETDFINCVSWRKTAELLNKYCKKGDKIAVSGNIQTRTYENKEGKKAYVTEVVAESIEFLTPKKAEERPPLTPLTEEVEEQLPF